MTFAVGCHKAPDDVAIATDIKSKMFGDPALKGADIVVQVNSGAVTLSGTAPSPPAQRQAVQVAQSAPGVTAVKDMTNLPGQPPPSTPNTPESYDTVTAAVPEGTELLVRTIDRIDSAVNRSGQTFRASLAEPVVINGVEVFPRGADVTLLLALAKRAGHFKGRNELEVRAETITVTGQSYPIRTNVIDQRGKSRGRNTALKTGGGAGVGALIGALAGGGAGAAIGAGAGAGAGLGYQAFTHGPKVVIHSESVIIFHLREPVNVTYRKNAPH